MDSSGKLSSFHVLKPDAYAASTGTADTELTPIQKVLQNASRTNGPFKPIPAQPTPVTVPPFSPAVMIAAPPAKGMEEEVAVRPVYSSSSAIIRTLTLVLKFSISGTIIFGGFYLVMHSVVPVIKELMHPGGTSALHDKDAPTFVKAIQETRLVVAKNDANVAYLNSLVGTNPKDGPADLLTPMPQFADEKAPLATKVPVPVTGPVKVTTYAPTTPPVVEASAIQPSSSPNVVRNLKPFNDAIADLKIDGVVGGRAPRIIIDGLLVKIGDVADFRNKLVFTGVDPVKHLIFFTNKDNVIFERHY